MTRERVEELSVDVRKVQEELSMELGWIENSRDGHTILEKVMVQRVFEPLQIISCKVKEKNDHEKV